MKIKHGNGLIDLDSILANIGCLEFEIDDCSEVSRFLYPDITEESRFVLKIRTINFIKLRYAQYCPIYRTYSREDAERMKEFIISEQLKGTEVLTIENYKKQEEMS